MADIIKSDVSMCIVYISSYLVVQNSSCSILQLIAIDIL
jgi:hypothetical protein